MSVYNPISSSEDARPPSARIEELLGQNEPPLPAEKEYLEFAVRQSNSTLSILDTRISHAREALDSLLRSKKEKEEEEIIQAAKIILHPMRSICGEILLEIFSWSVYDVSDIMDVGEPLDSLNPCHAPWTISQVNRRWRSITLASSRLRSNIALDFERYTYIGISNRMCMFKLSLYLKRARDSELSISLFADSDGFKGTLGLLEASTRQWRNLNINAYPKSVKALAENSFPLLRSLQVHSENIKYTPVESGAPKTVLAAPELRIFRSVSNAVPCSMLDLPWKRLETFSCSDASNPHCIRVLRQLSSAKSLYLRVHKRHTLDLAEGAIVMPSVESLTFEQRKGGERSMARLLDAFILPSITFLSLTFPKASLSHFPTTFDASTSLTSLSIDCHLSHAHNATLFFGFLRLTPNVTVSRLSSSSIPDEVLRDLTLAEGKDPIVPFLRVLEIAPGTSWCDMKLFMGMLESRCNDGDNIMDPTQGSSGEETYGPRTLKRLHFKRTGKLLLSDSEDRERWGRLCRVLEVLYHFVST
ncbi:hypothetical protein ARMGADRAFT_1091195 [Armillaria gallica]|uniref:F-box domain-containing protein n=1 Tax=Armillaria gallica TaxID=47427 RepID=A0A2H3CI99_ARMGA|nr:hypothetical protein ARMGADRAFT_1091195 [Armillaria gallica]